MNAHEQQDAFRRQQLVEQALERDAYLFRELMDPDALLGRPEAAHAEALRRTARGAVEDWLEAKRGG
jgi:hypothetical protein